MAGSCSVPNSCSKETKPSACSTTNPESDNTTIDSTTNNTAAPTSSPTPCGRKFTWRDVKDRVSSIASIATDDSRRSSYNNDGEARDGPCKPAAKAACCGSGAGGDTVSTPEPSVDNPEKACGSSIVCDGSKTDKGGSKAEVECDSQRA